MLDALPGLDAALSAAGLAVPDMADLPLVYKRRT